MPRKTVGYTSLPWRPYNNDEDATGEPGDGWGDNLHEVRCPRCLRLFLVTIGESLPDHKRLDGEPCREEEALRALVGENTK
jgi:hypothetical protein